MMSHLFSRTISYTLTLAAAGLLTHSAFGDNGTWITDASGNWSNVNDWQNGVVADGDTFTADFSTIDITGDRTVTLDGAHTISTLIFGDAGASPDHNWSMNGSSILTLGSNPNINVVNQNTTISVPLAGTAGMTKTGAGMLTFMGTNTYSGPNFITAGTVTYGGASAYGLGGSDYVVSNGVMNVATTGTIAITNTFALGGQAGNTLPFNGSAAVNQTSGTVRAGDSGGRYLEIGAGTNAYGCYTLSGGTLITPNASGLRVGTTGIGILNQTGGTLNCSRYFAVGTSTGGDDNRQGGRGVATLMGGTASLGSSGYKVILGDKANCPGVMNVGTEAGGNAVVVAASGNSGNGGIEFLDRASASGTINLNSGTLQTIYNIYRNQTGTADFNFNGGTLQAGGNNNLISATAPNLNVYKKGVVVDTMTFNTAILSPLLQAVGNGVYPAGGTLAISSGGGSGYIGAPLVAVSGGSGSGVMAIANVSGGVVTGVTITCPGQNYIAGDMLSFDFSGGGATTPASTFNYSLTAGDVSANSAGGLTKFGSGKLTLSTVNTYGGNTTIAAGILDVTVDSGLGGGNVNVSSGATLILENGSTNGYIADTGNLVIGSSGLVNLNFFGTDTINGLSLDGGATYVAPGTYGSSSSGAANVDDTHFSGNGVLNVTTSPQVTLTVVLQSSANPSVYGQSIDLTATVSSSGGGVPSGSVTFKDGSTELATLSLDGTGKAILTTNGLTVGSHPLTATYDSTTSQILVQVVNNPTDVWNGNISGVWDINNTLNWTVMGSPAAYQDGNNAQLDDSASGTTAITLNTAVNPLSLMVSNSSKAYSISGTGGIGGATGLTKLGSGSLTFEVANSYTGGTLISNGVVNYAPGSSSSGNGSLNIGGTSGRAVMNVNTTNTLSFHDLFSLGGNVGNTDDSGMGAINQTSGTFNSTGGGNAYLEIGAGGANAYGFYDLAAGALNTINASGIRVGCTGTGVFLQSGGSLNCGRYFAVGTQSGVNNIGGFGLATFTGGTATFASAQRIIVGDKSGSTGIFNLGTEAAGNAVLTNLFNNNGYGGLELLDNVGAVSATVNLNGGTLQLGGAIYRPSGAVGSPALNFNGATLQAGANNICLITNENSFIIGDFVANMFSRGIVVDSMANNCFIDADLRVQSGNGVYPAAGLLSVTDGGSGYIGAPLVTVSGGSGSGATAIANVANGVITSIAMTCPGQNYQVGDTLYFDFSNGGAITPAATFSYTLQAGDLKDNALGGLTKIGSGKLTLDTFNNDYTGATVVSNGTLAVAGQISGGGEIAVHGGAFGGTGSVSGPVTVYNGGTLTAGIDDVGTFTIYNNVTLMPGASFRAIVNKDAGTQNLVQGISQLTYAGTLVVSNMSGTYAVGDSFKLFDASSYSGSFTSIVPVSPGSGMAWDTSDLATSGTLKIVEGSAINPNPTNIVVSVSGNSMDLSWPTDHTGWILQAQTNALSVGLSNNWSNVAGSDSTNKVTVPITQANGAVFYRLVLPTP